MGVEYRLGHFWLGAVTMFALGLAATGASAQGATTVNLAPTLLPQSFGEWKAAGAPVAATGGLSLVNVSKQALEEGRPQRSQVADYSRGTRSLHIEAIEFDDRTGAYAAYSLVKRADMHEGTELGVIDSVGENAVLFLQGSSLVLVYPATAADVPSLKPLAAALPKPAGNKGVAPELPAFVPAKGLVAGSVRYAIGPGTYAGEGGVLPANSIDWNKSAEAVTAQYEDKRGKETLTVAVYPTPDIARAQARAFESGLPRLGPSFATAKVRQEAELVMLANGTFAPDEAQKMVENIHMKQMLSVDKDVQPVFHVEVRKTANLLVTIAKLFGLWAAAAIFVGLFLGGGRAIVRVMQGKPAAVEPEFLSLHLDPQNKPVQF